MPDFDYSDTDWDSISRLKKWYSGDVHDSMEHLGLWGHLEGISLLGSLGAGEVVCGPAVTVLFEESDRKGEPQDVYHHAIDNTPQGGILVCEASCAAGSCSGELMSSGAKTRGAAATIPLTEPDRLRHERLQQRSRSQLYRSGFGGERLRSQGEERAAPPGARYCCSR
jgi:4-hydroxy-4-methyl-2-oxoglutarate aldolase